MAGLTRDHLLNLGFVELGSWCLCGEQLEYKLEGNLSANTQLASEPNVLHAFVKSEIVQYVGKTTCGIKKRFIGYRTPGARQQTNLRCNKKIKEALKSGSEIRILVFAPISQLRYGDFDINLAAGLEDALIKAFAPPWNGREENRPITEEAEREEVEERQVEASDASDHIAGAPELDPTFGKPVTTFKIQLGRTYRNQGMINPGVDASHYLGANGEPIRILFDDDTPPVLSTINRTANASGGVRVVGGNRQIALWFQKHFSEGNIVEARVLGPHRILLMSS